MSRDELHQRANESTPASVVVPNTWAGLIVWAVGKWGVGAIFGLMLVWVYQDLQNANKAMVEVVRANTKAMEGMAQGINDALRHRESR